MLGCPKGSLESIGNFDLFEDVIKVGLYSVGADV
jgi:hypothetical protein